MKKQLLLLMMMLLPMMAMADDSGSCGENVTYTYVEATHTLTISGTGLMGDYISDNIPWYNYRTDIVKVIIEEGVTSIGYRAFSGCSGLTSVTIPNSVTSIGFSAFMDCSGLTSITIPNSVTSLGNAVFSMCSSLAFVTIGNSVTSIGEHAFSGCSGLTSISIPYSVKSIGDNAFVWCTGLTSITIPNSVTSIGAWAIANCTGLISIIIGNSVTSIGDYAFRNCTGLLDMFCYAENVPTAGIDAFIESNIAKAALHVPSGSVSAYHFSVGWRDFKNIIALTDSDPNPKIKCATPTVTLVAGKLTFSCETAGAVCHYEITRLGDGNTVALSSTSDYVVSVWATKDGYSDSDVATTTINMKQGDVNADGEVNVADLVTTTNIIMGKDE